MGLNKHHPISAYKKLKRYKSNVFFLINDMDKIFFSKHRWSM